MTSDLVTARHLSRKAVIYIRQSTPHQVLTNQESLRLQYARHRQVVVSRATELAGQGRRRRGAQAAAATPLMSAHVSNARALVARYSLAERWSRRRWKRLLIWSWVERNRCACRGDLKRFIWRSRRRVGWCEFSARLLRPLCLRCSTPGSRSFLAAP